MRKEIDLLVKSNHILHFCLIELSPLCRHIKIKISLILV